MSANDADDADLAGDRDAGRRRDVLEACRRRGSSTADCRRPG